MKLKYAKMHGVLAAILGGLSLFLIPSAVAAVADEPNEKVPERRVRHADLVNGGVLEFEL